MLCAVCGSYGGSVVRRSLLRNCLTLGRQMSVRDVLLGFLPWQYQQHQQRQHHQQGAALQGSTAAPSSSSARGHALEAGRKSRSTRQTTFFFVRGLLAACGGQRWQTLIEERQNLQEQRGSPQSASITFSWARNACLSGIRCPSLTARPPDASHVRACVQAHG